MEQSIPHVVDPLFRKGQFEEDDDLSEIDSDYENLQDDLVKLKESVYGILPHGRAYGDSEESGHQRAGYVYSYIRGHGRAQARGRGIARGPRKAAEPSGDIKSKLSIASQAFIDEDYEAAKDIVSEVIRVNAETYEAWTLLASIFKELGDTDKTLTALMYAAHLRPKDVAGWISCAKFALEKTGSDRKKRLSSARICYASAIRANPKDDTEARLGKAVVLRELGNVGSAISEYKRILGRRPHDLTILRVLAELYIDQDDVGSAITLYEESINFYTSSEPLRSQCFGWSDINIYVELYAYLGQYNDAIRELKSLSRWLLGRQSESFWDQYFDDDREFDVDDSRRTQTPDYNVNRFDSKFYGNGLPLELRVKLGLYRLQLHHHSEALSHLNWLEPENLSGNSKISDYPDLFRAAADSLSQANLYPQALTFYRTLQQSPETIDPYLQMQMGKCYLAEGSYAQAEACFQTTIRVDEENIEARVQLAKLYEQLNEQQQAFIYIGEIMTLRRKHDLDAKVRSDSTTKGNSFVQTSRGTRSSYKSRKLVDPRERQRQEEQRAARLQELYSVVRLHQNSMRIGQDASVLAWMEAARELIEDFRGFKALYPWDKYVHFLGYTSTSRAKAGATSLDIDLAAMADRISQKIGVEVNEKGHSKIEIPENYRGISFATWLDIFLEYALCLARFRRYRESYEICEAAKDAIVFYNSREYMFLIHVCWCTCAILASDEETCVAVCRFFMKEYQFTTDAYRMFAALARLCQSPISWYSSGPTQKYILRQIKAMDYALVDSEWRKAFFTEKGSYSTQDDSGKLIVNDDMDIALLMLYGHILYSGASYAYALNYFFRARALDPENPMINLSIGLGYIHHALKRQSENRQFHIMQGLTFLFDYYDARKTSSRVEERQEAHYNIARIYHLLGLSHLALPYYEKVLQEKGEARDSIASEELTYDVVYNLQTIYAAGGNINMVRHLTDTCMIV